MRLRYVFVLLAVLPAAVAAQQPGLADPASEARLRAVFPAVDSIMREFTGREHVPGAAWAIVVGDRVAHVGVTGLRDVGAKAPVDTGSVFRIASMTKSFTAMAIMRLRDEGRLSLDDPAEKYVPELKALKYPTSDSPRITIRHLLSHSTGFPEDNPWGDQQLARTDAELSAMIRKGIPFSNPPGVAYEYSNYGFAILGRIVTRASGTPYNDYIATHILRPLGMRSTTLSPTAVPAGRLAHGYRWEDERWKEEPQLPDGSFGAMGGMLTSLERPRPLRRGLPRRLAAAGWGGDRAGAAGVAAGDAAGLAAERAERGAGFDGRAAERGRVRVRASGVGGLRFRARGVAQRRAAGVRVADAVAAGVRGRDHRVREPDVHGVGAAGGGGAGDDEGAGGAGAAAGGAGEGAGGGSGAGDAAGAELG